MRGGMMIDGLFFRVPLTLLLRWRGCRIATADDAMILRGGGYMKKLLTSFVAFCFILLIPLNAFAATLGGAYTTPDAGYQRIDNTSTSIRYVGSGWGNGTYSGAWNNTESGTIKQGDYLEFKFTGSKVRVITGKNVNFIDSVQFTIDGVNYTPISQLDNKLTSQVLMFDKSNLSAGEHYFRMTRLSPDGVFFGNSTTMNFDAVEIGTGESITLTPVPTPTPTPTPAPTPTPTPDTSPPIKPIGLTGKGADKQAILTWTANTEPDLAQYNVYQDGSKVKSVTTAGTTVEGLKNGKTYAFKITAVDKSGNESAQSNSINVTPQDKIDVIAIPNADSIILQISGGTSPYLVQWGSDSDTTDASQFTVPGLIANTDYSVTVTDAAGLKWTGTVNTGDKKAYVPPTMPNANTLFQKMLDVFGTAGTIGLAIATAAVGLGVLIVLGFWGFRVAKRWLFKAT